MVVEAESTQSSSPEQSQEPQQPQQQLPPSQAHTDPPGSLASDSDYELDLCLSSSQRCCTFHFSYADHGPKASHSVMRPSAAYFKNYQMRLMTEDEQLHTMRMAQAQVLQLGQPLASAIRNIPKKRIRRLTSNNGATATAAAAATATAPGASASAAGAGGDQPSATSTPLAEKQQPPLRSEPLQQDENDLEVAAM